MSNNTQTHIALLEELVALLFDEVDALTEADYQEELDDLFPEAKQARKKVILRLLADYTPLPDQPTDDAKVTA